MAEEHIRMLTQARENFVRKRRDMAEQMVPDGAAGAHFAPNFSDLQDVIEAIDRAILDEERLLRRQESKPERKPRRRHRSAAKGPDDGASARPNTAEGANENVVEVDFEP